MKWRHSIIYLAIFLLVGGYFYYFEVVQKQHQQALEREARRVFQFEANQVEALEIHSGDKKLLRLVKDKSWQIVEPIRTEVDEATLDGFLSTAATLETEREVVAAPQDLQPYSLQEPGLKVRFLVAGKWLELVLGARNPVGDAYYAKTGEKSSVFLVSRGIWGVLNKGLDELRRKNLFAFGPEEVVGLQVMWRGGGSVRLTRREDAEGWSAPGGNTMKIKGSRVVNLLEQIQWLRAQKFLENETGNLKAHGLADPEVKVELQLKQGKSINLLLGKKMEGETLVAACSSELPGVVQVAADILDDLPGNVSDLEDRSVFALKAEEIQQIKWRLGESSGRVIRMGENKWGFKKEDGNPQELKDSWRVRSLLYDLQEVEYLKKLDPIPKLSEMPHGRLEFWSADRELAAFAWEQSSAEDSKPATLWMLEGGTTQAVQITAETASKIEEDVHQLVAGEEARGDK